MNVTLWFMFVQFVASRAKVPSWSYMSRGWYIINWCHMNELPLDLTKITRDPKFEPNDPHPYPN